ncbi:Protein FAR1-RELATED SEQUENCE 5 [Linum grandiflorum]
MDNHTHEMTHQRLARYMPSNRVIAEVDKSILRQYAATSIGPSKAYNTEKHKIGGHSNMGYIKRDAKDQDHRDTINQITEGDAATVLAYLESKVKKHKNFFLKYTTSNKERLERVLWADSMSITYYSFFGDLLLFDATYKKNIYNMPLIIFSGVNHHNQTSIFACAFVQHERVENYEWALTTLMEAIGNKTPKTAITDEDSSMAIAIAKVFQNAAHRLCSWHLQQNIV